MHYKSLLDKHRLIICFKRMHIAVRMLFVAVSFTIVFNTGICMYNFILF